MGDFTILTGPPKHMPTRLHSPSAQEARKQIADDTDEYPQARIDTSIDGTRTIVRSRTLKDALTQQNDPSEPDCEPIENLTVRAVGSVVVKHEQDLQELHAVRGDADGKEKLRATAGKGKGIRVSSADVDEANRMRTDILDRGGVLVFGKVSSQVVHNAGTADASDWRTRKDSADEAVHANRNRSTLAFVQTYMSRPENAGKSVTIRFDSLLGMDAANTAAFSALRTQFGKRLIIRVDPKKLSVQQFQAHIAAQKNAVPPQKKPEPVAAAPKKIPQPENTERSADSGKQSTLGWLWKNTLGRLVGGGKKAKKKPERSLWEGHGDGDFFHKVA